MLAFSIDYYGIFFGATQSVELFCTYRLPNNRRWFEKKYGFKVYKPKRYLVVGRRNDFECDEWIEIKSDYTDVEIVTYDDLVDTVVSQFYQ